MASPTKETMVALRTAVAQLVEKSVRLRAEIDRLRTENAQVLAQIRERRRRQLPKPR